MVAKDALKEANAKAEEAQKIADGIEAKADTRTHGELITTALALGIPGAETMTRDELKKAIAEARRYHVALVDKMPAGFEPLNPALAVTEPVPPDENAAASA